MIMRVMLSYVENYFSDSETCSAENSKFENQHHLFLLEKQEKRRNSSIKFSIERVSLNEFLFI